VNELVPLAGGAGAPEPQSLLDRAVGNLRDLWRGIADQLSQPDDGAIAAGDLKALRRHMQACLDARGGEVTARARAAVLGHDYLALEADGRAAFLRLLAEEFGPAPEAIAAAARGYLVAAADRDGAVRALRAALESPRVRLLTQFNVLPEGVKFLVDVRAELLRLASGDPVFAPVRDELTALLRSWFDVGFLELRRITWDAPASLLEKLIAYEAVHEIASWDDLKDRLDSDRRCFAFFHPRMPEEPLIFVEVALTSGIAGNIQALLDPNAPVLDPAAADTAIFYSISNAQRGLAGISFGNFLIKRVVELLSAEFPNLRRFATLSPLPGFADWLGEHSVEDLLTAAERKALPNRDGDQHPLSLTRSPHWYGNAYLAKALKEPLTRLAARYLLRATRPDGRLRDSVAHFHLTNGARVERIDWLGDTSPKGLRESLGVMVNYLYQMDAIEANHEAYSGEGKVTAASAVRGLAARKSKAKGRGKGSGRGDGERSGRAGGGAA
jgi:malonyl-CoA decarboxylase